MRVQDGHALRAQTTFRRVIYCRILVLLRMLPLHLLLSKASSKWRIERHRTSTSGHNYRIDIDRKLCSCLGVQSSYLPPACFHTLDQRDVMFEQNGSTACFTHVHEHFCSQRILVSFVPATQSTATFAIASYLPQNLAPNLSKHRRAVLLHPMEQQCDRPRRVLGKQLHRSRLQHPPHTLAFPDGHHANET
jgi:hypothetical protein